MSGVRPEQLQDVDMEPGIPAMGGILRHLLLSPSSSRFCRCGRPHDSRGICMSEGLGPVASLTRRRSSAGGRRTAEVIEDSRYAGLV